MDARETEADPVYRLRAAWLEIEERWERAAERGRRDACAWLRGAADRAWARYRAASDAEQGARAAAGRQVAAGGVA